MITLLFTLAASAIAPITLSVEGEGYLRFARDGRVVYAKSARLIAQSGKLVHESGASLMPLVALPEEAQSVEFAPNGEIMVVHRGAKKPAGRIMLASFAAGTASRGDGAYLIFSQRPNLGYPGDQGFGTIRADGIAKTAFKSESIARPTAQGSNASIEALPSTELSGTRILLGDIARVSGPAQLTESLSKVDLGPSPAIGVTQRISEFRIAAALRQAGFDPQSIRISCAAPVEVRRKSQKVTPDQFVQAAITALGQAASASSWKCVDAQPDFVAPVGPIELKAEDVSANGTTATVKVAVYVDGKRFNSRTVRLSGDVSAAGVKSGSLVKVRFVSGGIVGEISGRVKSTAFVGQNVEVSIAFDPSQPPTSHLGTVIGPGLVEVKIQ